MNKLNYLINYFYKKIDKIVLNEITFEEYIVEMLIKYILKEKLLRNNNINDIMNVDDLIELMFFDKINYFQKFFLFQKINLFEKN